MEDISETAKIASLPKAKASRERKTLVMPSSVNASYIREVLRETQQYFGERYGLDLLQSLKLPATFEEQVRLAEEMYKYEGVVGNVINLMVDFSTTEVKHVTKNKKVKKFFDAYFKYSNLDDLIEKILLDYYLCGEVFVYRGDRQIIEVGPDFGTVYYPYTTLNPLKVSIEEIYMFGEEIYSLVLPPELATSIKKLGKRGRPSKKDEIILKRLPSELRNFDNIVENKAYLDPNRVLRISYKRRPYMKYTIPPLARAFIPYLLKKRMRELDLQSIEGNINSILLVKVGNDQYPATKKQLEAVEALFRTGAKSLSVFWNHAIDVEVIRGNPDVLSSEKYRQINRDLLDALGMPPSLIGGAEEGGRFANAWASIVALVERLEGGREAIKRALEKEYRRIAIENNLPEVPEIKFKKTNLREERVYKNILLSMYDRGLLDIETVLEDSDYSFEQVLSRKENEQDIKELFAQPYNSGGLFVGPTKPKAPSGKEGGEGRPIDNLSNDYTERPPQEGPRLKNE